MNINLFKRHIFSTVVFISYLIWLIFVVKWFNSVDTNNPNSCGAANGALIVATGLLVVIISILILSQIILTRGQQRIDYLKYLGLLYIPIILIIAYIYIIGSIMRQ